MGADRALVYAGTDERVMGTVLIDPSIPPTWRFYLRRYTRAMLSYESWRRLLGKSAQAPQLLQRYVRERRLRTQGSARQPGEASVREFFADAYRAAVAAEVQILAVFTGGIARRFNYRDQLTDAFPEISFGNLLRVEYLEDKDHLFSLEADRLELFAISGAWLRAIAPSNARPAPHPSASSRGPVAASVNQTEVEF